MLTIKHIRLSGEEMLYSSPIVNFVPNNATQRIGDPDTVWIEPVGQISVGSRYPLTGGTVFVMNDFGKTVARYDIGASMVPLGDESKQPAESPALRAA